MKTKNLPERIESPDPKSESALFFAERVSAAGNIGMHWHNFYELDFIESGSGTQFLNGIETAFIPGTLTILFTSDFHAYELDEKKHERFTTYSFHFSEDFITDEAIKKLLLELRGNQFDPENEAVSHAFYNEFTLLFSEYFSKNKNRENMIRNIVGRIILIADRIGVKNVKTEKAVLSVFSEIHYIDKHFRQPLRLADVAEAVGFSPTYFSKVFKKRYRITFQEYLLGKRLQWAYGLIRSSYVPITQISYDAGFNNHTYFCKCFKEKYGTSPVAIRKIKKHD